MSAAFATLACKRTHAPMWSPPFCIEQGASMRTAKFGDAVQVHFVGRLQRGGAISSRGGPPVRLTVGFDHPRLPGLGLALAGLGAGERATVQVSAEHAFGL